MGGHIATVGGAAALAAPGRPLLPLPVCQLRVMHGHRIGHERLLRNKSRLGFSRIATAIEEASPKPMSPRRRTCSHKSNGALRACVRLPPNSGARADIPGPALWARLGKARPEQNESALPPSS